MTVRLRLGLWWTIVGWTHSVTSAANATQPLQPPPPIVQFCSYNIGCSAQNEPFALNLTFGLCNDSAAIYDLAINDIYNSITMNLSDIVTVTMDWRELNDTSETYNYEFTYTPESMAMDDYILDDDATTDPSTAWPRVKHDPTGTHQTSLAYAYSSPGTYQPTYVIRTNGHVFLFEECFHDILGLTDDEYKDGVYCDASSWPSFTFAEDGSCVANRPSYNTTVNNVGDDDGISILWTDNEDVTVIHGDDDDVFDTSTVPDDDVLNDALTLPPVSDTSAAAPKPHTGSVGGALLESVIVLVALVALWP